MAFDGMSITVEVHEGPTIHKVTVENLKQSIKSQGIRGGRKRGGIMHASPPKTRTSL